LWAEASAAAFFLYRKLRCRFVTLTFPVLYNVLNCNCNKSAGASGKNVVDFTAVGLAVSSHAVFFDQI